MARVRFIKIRRMTIQLITLMWVFTPHQAMAGRQMAFGIYTSDKPTTLKYSNTRRGKRFLCGSENDFLDAESSMDGNVGFFKK